MADNLDRYPAINHNFALRYSAEYICVSGGPINPSKWGSEAHLSCCLCEFIDSPFLFWTFLVYFSRRQTAQRAGEYLWRASRVAVVSEEIKLKLFRWSSLDSFKFIVRSGNISDRFFAMGNSLWRGVFFREICGENFLSQLFWKLCKVM